MKTSLVSIPIPVYNGEKYLKEQLDSIYNQTYKKIEVIASDDGSTDASIDILEDYSTKYGLKYQINKKNLGYVKNFEQLISQCNGEYIALANQDDIWFPHKIEYLVNEITPYSIICSDAVLIDENGKKISSSFKTYSHLPAKSGRPFKQLTFNNFVTGPTILFHRDFVTKILPMPKGIKFTDWWFALVASALNGIKYLNVPLIFYRRHQEAQTPTFKNYPLVGNILRFFKTLNKPRTGYDYRSKAYQQIEAALASSLFDNSQRVDLEEALVYYRNALEARIPLKAVKLAIKNRDLLFFGFNSPLRLIYSLQFLFEVIIRLGLPAQKFLSSGTPPYFL